MHLSIDTIDPKSSSGAEIPYIARVCKSPITREEALFSLVMGVYLRTPHGPERERKLAVLKELFNETEPGDAGPKLVADDAKKLHIH
jgi:hypothetical protein